jgi:hypothetical protein
MRTDLVFRETDDQYPHNPNEISALGPNWSFATSQGTWFNGAGRRKGSGGGWVCAARWSMRQLMA